jgi:hypothetical protein
MELVAKHDAISEVIFRLPYPEAELLDQYRTSGGPFAKHTLMFMVTSQKQVVGIADRFDSATIEIKLDKSDPANEKKLELIRYAHNKRFIVETHAEGSNDDWLALLDFADWKFFNKKPSRSFSTLAYPDAKLPTHWDVPHASQGQQPDARVETLGTQGKTP